MNSKPFSLGAILNMSTGRLITQMDDVYELANFMTGDNLFTHQLPRAFEPCQKALKEQLPFLASPEMQYEETRLSEMLGTDTGKSNRKELIKGWLFVLQGQFGKEHPVTPLAEWQHKDPIVEAVEMKGSKSVKVV